MGTSGRVGVALNAWGGLAEWLPSLQSGRERGLGLPKGSSAQILWGGGRAGSQEKAKGLCVVPWGLLSHRSAGQREKTTEKNH